MAAGVDYALLAELSDEEMHALLKEAGVKPGHRFKLVKAFAAWHAKHCTDEL